MEYTDKSILVCGATGQQGGSVARALIAKGWRVRALSRDPNKPAAQALVDQGVEVVQGDMGDRASLERALQGVYGVFSVQNTWEAGPEKEIEQGKTLADAARAAGVQHFVYSSVGGAERQTGIPHFESKAEIERHTQALDMQTTILRPVFFMENFSTSMRPQEMNGVLTFAVALQPDVSLQLVAVDDIGEFARIAFENPQEYAGKALEIAGDSLTGPQIAALMRTAIGKPVQFVSLPIEQVRSFSEDLAIMFDWFNREGYQADIPALRNIHPGLLDFKTWLLKSRYGKS